MLQNLNHTGFESECYYQIFVLKGTVDPKNENCVIYSNQEEIMEIIIIFFLVVAVVWFMQSNSIGSI